MLLKVFAVYDAKISEFRAPFTMAAVGLALRGWETVVNDPSTEFFKYPSDFVLFELGEFDCKSGRYSALDAPRGLGSALEFRSKPADVAQMQMKGGA